MTEILRSTPELRRLIIVVATVIGEAGNFVPTFSKQIIEDALVFRSEEKKKIFLKYLPKDVFILVLSIKI